jgi:hypothetical protein
MSTRPLPAREGSAGPVIRHELALHVNAWRLRLDPDTTTGLRQGWSTRQRRRDVVSQEQVAQLAGCSTFWFTRLELGHIRDYSNFFLTAVAEVLQLDDAETRLLFLLVGKQPPVLQGEATPIGLEPVLQAQPWPSYLSDQVWDVVSYNTKILTWFPWVQHDHANVMRWVFTDPEARRRLYRWESDWAPQLLAELRVRQLRRPDDQRLRLLISEVLEASTQARRWWDQPIPRFRQPGDRRFIVPPGANEPHPINVVALQPPQAPDHRLVMLAPASA